MRLVELFKCPYVTGPARRSSEMEEQLRREGSSVESGFAHQFVA